MSAQSPNQRIRSQLLSWSSDKEFQSIFTEKAKQEFTEMSALAKSYYNRKADKMIPQTSHNPIPNSTITPEPRVPDFVRSLKYHIQEVTAKIESLNEIMGHFSSLNSCLDDLDSGIGTLYAQNESTLAKRQQLKDHITQIEWGLRKMAGFEQIKKTIAIEDDLGKIMELLEEITDSIQFVQEHGHFIDSKHSLTMWNECLEESLSIAVVKFIKAAEKLFSQGTEKDHGFAETLNKLVGLLQKSSNFKFAAALSDLYNQYSNLRVNQIVPSLAGRSPSESLSELCSVIKRERQLLPSIPPTCFIERLCQFIQGMIRPVIRSAKLSEIANCLQNINDISAYLRTSGGDCEIPRSLQAISGDLLEYVVRLTDNLCQSFRQTGLEGINNAIQWLDDLHKCCDSAFFTELASQIMSSAVSAFSVKSENVEDTLHVIHNALLLREKLTLLHVGGSVYYSNFDFSNLKNAVRELFSKKFFQMIATIRVNTLLNLVLNLTPVVREDAVELYGPLDDVIRTKCESLYSFSKELVIPELMGVAGKLDNVGGTVGGTLVKEAISNSFVNLSDRLGCLIDRMEKVMNNPTHCYILLGPIKAQIKDVFIKILSFVNSGRFTEEEIAGISCPGVNEVDCLFVMGD